MIKQIRTRKGGKYVEAFSALTGRFYRCKIKEKSRITNGISVPKKRFGEKFS
jgi:hypothetical protein